MAIEAAVRDYYEAAMPRLLADIGGRPVYFVRPDPENSSAWAYERHPLPDLAHVRTLQVVNSKGELADFAVVDDAEGVRELLAHGAVEFHPWGARADDVEHADRLVFDVDPGEGVGLAEVKRAAVDLREHLAGVGLRSFVRTSGRKGLHVVAPLRPARAWPEVRVFARAVAENLTAQHPDRYVAKAALKLRPGKIFIDYLRNGRGTTAASSYSLRAAAGWPAALPLAWEELDALEAPDAFPADVARRRLAAGYTDPWKGFDAIDQTFQ